MMKKRTPGVRVLAVLCFPAVLCSLTAATTHRLAAQSPRLQADLELVRGIVTDLRFIDLAQYEVEQLKKTHKDSNDFKLVAQLAIEVSLQGAKRHPDRDSRSALYKDAIERSSEFIERYTGEQVAQDARVTLSDACIEFGFFLNEELEIAREEAPDKVPNLEEEAAAVFRKGVAAALKCEEEFKAKASERGQTDAFLACMRRGILLREHARAVKKDRGYLCDQANTVFEELILEVGEETILGQKALFEKSKIEEVKGDLDAAIQSYKDAISAIYTALKDEEVNLPESAQRLMFDMMQEIYDRLATVSFMGGRVGEIAGILEQYDARVKEFRTVADPTYHDSVQLTLAQVLAGSGKQVDVSTALKTAKSINEEHPSDFVGLKAKNLIRSILRTSSDLVTGELLLEVARGDYQEQAFDAAIAGFKRSLHGMDDATRKRLGFDTWEMIGRSEERLQRNLEAALAYSRALAEFGADLQSDEKNQQRLQSIATRAMSCLGRAIASSGKAPIFDGLRQQVEAQLADFAPSTKDKGDYVKGIAAKNAHKLDEAARFFFEVKPDYVRYELAQGHGIECLFRLGKFDEARARIAAYREYVAGNPIPENERERRGYRPQALAWVHYTEGRILYEQATGKGQRPDPTKFRDLEKHFLEFETEHAAAAPAQMIKVHEMLGHAYLEMGEEAKAIERYSKLKALSQSTPDAHKALAILVFQTYSDQAKAIEAEIKNVPAGSPTREIEARLNTTRRKAMDMALDYAKSVGKPQYEVLYNAMRLAEQLEDWPKCEWAGEQILKLYSDSNKASLRQVKPLLGYAKLRQPGRLQEALDVLDEAEKELGSGKKTSSYYEVLRFKALALGGWPAYGKDGLNYEPNLGMGKPDKAYDIFWGDDYRKFATNASRTPKYSLEWYRYHLEIFFFCRQAQRIDSKFKQRAETFYNTARSTDDFATLKSLGPEGIRIFNLFALVK